MYRLNNLVKKYSDIKGECVTALDGLSQQSDSVLNTLK